MPGVLNILLIFSFSIEELIENSNKTNISLFSVNASLTMYFTKSVTFTLYRESVNHLHWDSAVRTPPGEAG